jgi:SAM-dependent methyltransferase
VNPWATPEMVAGFVQSSPNSALIEFAGAERSRGNRRALDIGCGAARNALPLARSGWTVCGTDTSAPMLEAAAGRGSGETPAGKLHLVSAAMDALPVTDAWADLVIAHGIWNLARSSDEFRRAVREAARAARPGAALFLFTFSRSTLPPDAEPVAGEPFVFTQFSGQPQCFLTREQIVEELGRAGFRPDAMLALRELNRPGGLVRATGPVIFQGAFRLTPDC